MGRRFKMRAYGSDTGHWLNEDYGERGRKMTGKNRTALRRLLHQRARRAAKKEIEKKKDSAD